MDSHTPATLSPGLLESYRQAVYTVHDRESRIVLTVGRPSVPLDTLLTRSRMTHAALITACNPCSRALPGHANRRRMRRLELALAGLRLRRIPATNSDPHGTWPDEPAALILGISPCTADALAKRFEQWGYLWLAINRPVELRVRRTSALPYRPA